MRSLFAALALLVAAVALATVAAGSPAPTRVSLSPALRLLSLHPVHVRGIHFRPGERVTITLSTTVQRVRHARATAAGSFVVGFGGVPISHCSGFAIRAVGSQGSVAVYKLQRPACLPVRSPS
jgi:uncharacterized membrane protein YedE/YeeE